MAVPSKAALTAAKRPIDTWAAWGAGRLCFLHSQAIAYALGQWPILITFLEDGHLELVWFRQPCVAIDVLSVKINDRGAISR